MKRKYKRGLKREMARMGFDNKEQHVEHCRGVVRRSRKRGR